MFSRSSGILAHPTSFPGKYGIGDLGKGTEDFLNFLRNSGQKLWQVLPLGPTSFADSPYQSFSTFAGNHLLISPDILVEEGYLITEDVENAPEFDENLIDYGEVITYKNALFKKAYSRFKESAGSKQKTAFSAFCKKNKTWLDDYALFVAVKGSIIEERRYTYESPEHMEYKKLMGEYLTENEFNDYFYGAVWNSWPKDIANRLPAAIKSWNAKLADEISCQKFLQYEFFRQWELVKKTANESGIQIIGDIPIFVAADSADVWANRSLFKIDENGIPTSVAGVPPDYFSETGQLWGNPLYDWNELEKSGYSWWVERIRKNLETVDIIRIDHFRGFESYWQVPYGEKTALNGKWEKGPGSKLFTVIKKQLGSLPIIAEDLGIITDKVTKLRTSLMLPGMKVLQFGFSGQTDNLNLSMNFEAASCAVYTGTHDNDTTVGWYQSLDEPIADQVRRYLNVSGEDISWDMIRLAFFSVAVIAVVPIQDVMSLGNEMRMNVPGIPFGNWRFRYTAYMLTSELAERLRYLSDITGRLNTAGEDDHEEI